MITAFDETTLVAPAEKEAVFRRRVKQLGCGIRKSTAAALSEPPLFVCVRSLGRHFVDVLGDAFQALREV